MREEEIKEILDKLSNRKQETLIQGLRECQLKDIEHPFITKEEYIDKLLNHTTSLQQKVEQLENIRKEAMEYIERDKLNIDESQCYVETQTGWKMIPKIYDDLSNILNKGSESNVKDKR